eukprot:COSAG02_NODE_419_length_22613_cov_22.994492_4_plen_115_part_00
MCDVQDTVDEMNKLLTSRIAGLTDDVASLNASLSSEKSERVAADDNINTKLLAQCEKVRRTCREARWETPPVEYTYDRNGPAYIQSKRCGAGAGGARARGAATSRRSQCSAQGG